MNRFQRVVEILDNAVGGPTATIFAHGPFWRNQTKDQFVARVIFELPIITVGDGAGSNLVKALRGEEPFGTLDLPRMPAGGLDPVPAEQIAEIEQWIDDGCPEEAQAPLGPLEIRLNGAASGEAFVIISGPAQPLPATLSLRTTDGSEGEVRLRARPGGTTLSVSPERVQVSAAGVEVQVLAATPSSRENDAAVEVVQGDEVLASFELTAIASPVVRFRGRYQCRLATNPDPFDHPWGEQSSFGLYAVRGPDKANPDEPPLDRVIRFHDAVALRPFCRPVGVSVVGIEAEVGGTRVRFQTGDPLLGQPVRLGPGCTFDERDGAFAPAGFQPISDFRLEIGSVFAGAAAPAVRRRSPQDPPGSTAPYADGIFDFEAEAAPWPPSEFGHNEATWSEHAWAVVARKLARLVAQQADGERAARIRERRLRQHAGGLAGIRKANTFMQRFMGLIDRELTVDPNLVGALAYLSGLPAIQFYAEFLDFDSDCQTGSVTGTLGAPTPLEPAPTNLQTESSLRRELPR
jgi:hypothetical protein